MSELVDYERAASRYDQGRALSAESMTKWQAAVADRLPTRSLERVVDLGAGTGLFLQMWASLGAREIVAVDPSPAMRALARDRTVRGTQVVAGAAANIPVLDESVDVVWMSTVIHHIPDLDTAAAELSRVVRAAGRVLVRGFFPGTIHVPWLDEMPGANKARLRFPTVPRVADILGRAGLALIDVLTIPEPEGRLTSEYVTWIKKMRNADSMLTALSDDDIEGGIASLQRMGEQRLDPTALSLLTFENQRPGQGANPPAVPTGGRR